MDNFGVLWTILGCLYNVLFVDTYVGTHCLKHAFFLIFFFFCSSDGVQDVNAGGGVKFPPSKVNKPKEVTVKKKAFSWLEKHKSFLSNGYLISYA